MSVWNDPRVKTGRIKFEAIGDRVRGRITAVAVYEGQANGFEVTLADVSFRQQGQNETKAEGSFIATATNLVGQLKTLAPKVGDVLDVELSGLNPVKLGTAKIFTVKVNEGAAPAAVPPPQSTTPEESDPFA
jgi:hypothetical protein